MTDDDPCQCDGAGCVVCGYVTLSTVLRTLTAPLDGIDMGTAPTVLQVRCGLGSKPCGRHLGAIVESPVGLAWLPASPLPDHAEDLLPEAVPMLLPTTAPEQREHYCEVISGQCLKGHRWSVSIPASPVRFG